TSAPAQGGPPSADGRRDYLGVDLAPGDGLDLEAGPPRSLRGPENGTFGYSADGGAFVAAATRGSLALLTAQEPGTRERCAAEQAPALVAQIPRPQLAPSARLCVVGVDGLVAVVTVRQLPAAGGPAAHATLDVTVWPARRL
ncbi:MAG: hypothetical protein HOY69_16680, partial [Streptomyces sp.]|nr:hypothetical protein [Streptomyces sp.]